MWEENGEKRTGTIPRYYAAATGKRLQAKGPSWSQVFFVHPETKKTRSLQQIKFYVRGPKRAVSAFLYFSKEIRESMGDQQKNFARKSGEMWKSLSKEEQAVKSIYSFFHSSHLILEV